MVDNSAICFTSDSFNRQALNRTNKSLILQQFNDDNSRFLLYRDTKFLIDDQQNIHFMKRAEAAQYDESELQWKYLGELESGGVSGSCVTKSPLFVAQITKATSYSEQGNWQSLRKIGLFLTPQLASLLIFAQGLLNWHAINRFCTVCGTEVREEQVGHALICTNGDCSTEVFPRTDPAVIVLVYNDDACLLGRSASWPENMFSCLAGFVETGEDLNSAVRREVFEESGIKISKINYLGSQPWPFPQSLMLGFHAETQHRELTFHDGEIQDARWFTREELIEAVRCKSLHLAPSISISYHLIEDWFNQKSDEPLSDILRRIKTQS